MKTLMFRKDLRNKMLKIQKFKIEAENDLIRIYFLILLVPGLSDKYRKLKVDIKNPIPFQKLINLDLFV